MDALPHATATRSKRRQRRGIACVEFAVVLPLLFFVVLGVCELSRAVMVKEILSDAARNGCRAGIVPGATNEAITAKINTVLTNSRLSTADATINISVNGPALSVKVSIPYAKVAWTGTFFYMSAQSIESEKIVMMRQG
jgi:Flp pilus assembly protein TadG